MNLFTNFKGSITELVVLSDSYKYDERMYGGMEHWLILTSMRPSDLLDELKERADVKSFKWFNTNDAASRVRKVALTSREVEVLEKAYELGYFNWPKDISLSELAKVLGVSKATLTQELRSIVRKLALREVTRIREYNALARLFE
ncbi:helix-turn-helix domain-containing protein [Caldivirga sp.]|uniref:helix-turn-helix domain-containing protein n=1 Tax=Caldivirga sp. TaxID=2080243 RepID=UPI003D0D6AE8